MKSPCLIMTIQPVPPFPYKASLKRMLMMNKNKDRGIQVKKTKSNQQKEAKTTLM